MIGRRTEWALDLLREVSHPGEAAAPSASWLRSALSLTGLCDAALLLEQLPGPRPDYADLPEGFHLRLVATAHPTNIFRRTILEHRRMLLDLLRESFRQTNPSPEPTARLLERVCRHAPDPFRPLGSATGDRRGPPGDGLLRQCALVRRRAHPGRGRGDRRTASRPGGLFRELGGRRHGRQSPRGRHHLRRGPRTSPRDGTLPARSGTSSRGQTPHAGAGSRVALGALSEASGADVGIGRTRWLVLDAAALRRPGALPPLRRSRGRPLVGSRDRSAHRSQTESVLPSSGRARH